MIASINLVETPLMNSILFAVVLDLLEQIGNSTNWGNFQQFSEDLLERRPIYTDVRFIACLS